MARPVLETKGLRKRYRDVEALRGVDLSVQQGEVFGFLGPNGAGKTTFTKCVTGFIKPSGGQVRILGVDAVRSPTAVARHIGLVPDQYDFYPNLTGRQHLDFYGRLLGMPRAQRLRRIDEVLELVRMTGDAGRRTKGYSHGMKQRICIGQAILHEPKLVLFDEPTNGLDPKGAHELRELIRSLAKDGTTVFLNSHVLHEVEQTCSRVAVLDHGRIVKVGSVSELRGLNIRGSNTIRVQKPAKKHLAAVQKTGAATVVLEGDTIRFDSDAEGVADAVAALVAAGGRIIEVRPAGNLEQAFLHLTEGR